MSSGKQGSAFTQVKQFDELPREQPAGNIFLKYILSTFMAQEDMTATSKDPTDRANSLPNDDRSPLGSVRYMFTLLPLKRNSHKHYSR